MLFALHGRAFSIKKVPYIKEIIQELEKRQVELIFSESFASILKKMNLIPKKANTFKHYNDLSSVNFIFSIGGDGTLLETVTLVRDKNIPIVGINMGRLGFLSSIPQERVVEIIQKIFEHDYILDRRTLIAIDSKRDLFDGVNFALNEFTIFKRDTSSMIVIHAYIDNEYLNSYWADGLIVSTPTGSTGYSLSVGGPVVIPHSNNFIITPVNPHTLTVRPLIVSDSVKISFQVEQRGKSFLVSLDSRSTKVISLKQMTIKKCNFSIQLLSFRDIKFLNTLRLKLNWGYDTRN